MRRIATGLLLATMSLSSVIGCSYGAMVAHDGKIYIARNDSFLFGALRKLYEFTPSAGSMACVQVKGKP
jgi:hypothetical protein